MAERFMIYEHRCKQCNALLFKEHIKEGLVEIKCPKCNTYSIIDREKVKDNDWNN